MVAVYSLQEGVAAEKEPEEEGEAKDDERQTAAEFDKEEYEDEHPTALFCIGRAAKTTVFS